MKVKSEKSSGTKKENFTAADLLERKNVFHRNLIDIVKKHHKVMSFIDSKSRPWILNFLRSIETFTFARVSFRGSVAKKLCDTLTQHEMGHCTIFRISPPLID